MTRWGRSVILILMLAVASMTFAGVTAPLAAAQTTDEEVPPGNPVIGSDRPGDLEPENDTRYALWGLVAGCLIVAGVLLVKIERWEASRSGDAATD